MKEKEYDAIIIGSGFGGSMTAKKLAEAGWKVAIIERGSEVKRGPHNWDDKGTIDLSPHYDKSIPYNVTKGGNKKQMGVYAALGGPSIFYGGVSFRFRENDFHPPQEIIGDSGAEWPIHYEDLEKYYDEAEAILNICGESGVDPTEPYRSKPFPQAPAPYADISKKIKSAAESLGLNPFRLPLAINYEDKSRNTCQLCTTCDTFACAIGAKNDLDTMVIQKLDKNKVTIIPNTLAYHISASEGKVKEILCVDLLTNENVSFSSKVCILSAGALASPQLILNSELEKFNPAGHVIGRYLMRHSNVIIFGIFPGVADKENRFHKELAILDFYFGHESIDYPKHKLGSLQQVPTPPSGLVENEAPFPLGIIAGKAVKLLTGLLAIAEDQPQFKNYIKIDKSQGEINHMAKTLISHEYTDRDTAAIKALITQGKKIMLRSGAWMNYVHHIRTFSHAVGTVRMGVDPKTSALDKNCKFRGLDNMYIVDASFMPTSAAVNPSLTISANALRVAEHIINQHALS